VEVPLPPAPADPADHLDLLGPPRLVVGGRVVQPGARKAIALLAYLSLEGRATRARLAALFWADLDAASARRNLRRELHRLRAAGADLLRDEGDDVLAIAPSLANDVQVFERALEAGDTARAAAVYRGPLLDGFDLAGPGAFEAWAAHQRERLAQRFRGALQTEVARHEAAGAWREALAGLHRLMHDDALHERHHRDAMRVHARLGEREAALQLYERLRRLLGRELGLRPMPETVALAESIRRGEAAAGSPDATVPAGLPPDADPLAAALPFTGRAAALMAITTALAAGRSAWLLGDGGIGKTRLAHEAAARRGRFLVVAARPGDEAVPYGTLRRWLEERADAALLAQLPAWARQSLAHVLPACGPVVDRIDTAADRDRLQAALDAAFAATLPPDAATLVFEDWHAADGATLAWWMRPTAAAVPAARIVTARDAELPAALRESLAQAERAGRASVCTLGPLAADEVAALVRALSGAAHPELARRLHGATAGNPMFVHETLRHLAQVGDLAVGPAGWRSRFDAASAAATLPVPGSVRDAVRARLALLDEPLRRLLEAASLAGGSFDAADLAGATALDDFERVAAIEAACAQRLLVHDDTGALRFGHDLVAQALAEGLSRERRRLLHRRLAASLERRRGPAARIAWHLEQAGLPARALRWRLAAAAAAESVYAHAEALAEYAAALADAPPPAEAARIRLKRARVLQRGSRAADADREFEAAEQAALDAGDADAAVGVLLAKAEHLCMSNRVDAALALVDGLLGDGLLAPVRQVEALEIRADGLTRRGESAQADTTLREALQRLPAGPSALRGRLLMAIGRLAGYRGDFDFASAWFDKAIRNASVLGALEPLARATFMRGTVDLNRARYPAAAELLQRSWTLAARAGSVPVQRGAILNLVKLYTQTGEVPRALDAIEAGEALSPLWESFVAEGAFLQARYYCHVLLGQLDEAFAALPRVLAQGESCDELYWRIGAATLVVDLLLLTGDLDAAAAQLERLRALCADDRDGYHRPLVEAKLAWLELLRGVPQAALARITALEGPGATLAETVDLRRHVEGAARLALGDAAGALDAVPDPAASSTEESKALQWAVRLRAEAAAGGLGAATRTAVQRLLADTARLPVLEGLQLRRALATVLRSAEPRAAAEQAAAADATLAALQRRLAGRPAQAALLARALPPLGTPSNVGAAAA
jgi:DNA-binding SARP family transcriptional activator/tetratricopeptide (TPR) repeat protein